MTSTEQPTNPLLNNKYAPVTFNMGFIETPFLSLCSAFQEWFKTIDAKFPGLSSHFTPINAPLATALLSLEPLTTPLDRYLLVETKSNWTALFASRLRGSDVASSTGYLPKVLNCRGLHVGHAPDFSKSKRKDLIRKWGSTSFTLNGPIDTDWLSRIRHIHVWNDVGGWAFDEGGELQPFEELESYKKRRIRDRFTFDMLVRYCRALGIDQNREDFFGPRSCAIRTTGQKHRGDLSMSIAQARSHLDL